MKIEEINIDGFGKFHKYHCQTSGKLEVFYGKNESGKTTLRKFMIAMLFGLEKSRGLAARYDEFHQISASKWRHLRWLHGL